MNQEGFKQENEWHDGDFLPGQLAKSLEGYTDQWWPVYKQSYREECFRLLQQVVQHEPDACSLTLGRTTVALPASIAFAIFEQYREQLMELVMRDSFQRYIRSRVEPRLREELEFLYRCSGGSH